MTRPRLSLQARLLIAFGAIAVVAVAVAAAITVTTHRNLVQQVDEKLVAFSGPGGAIPPVARDGGPSGTVVTDSDSPSTPDNERPSDVFRGVVNEDGILLVRFSPNINLAETGIPVIDPADCPERGTAYFTTDSTTSTTEYRVFAQRTGPVVEITALPLDQVNEATRHLILIQALGIVAVLAGLALAAQWVVRLGLAPMRRMVAASKEIAGGDLDVRVPDEGHSTETAELADALNAMIERLTDSLDQKAKSEAKLRDFVADASHELRTPITTILGYAQLYQRGALSDPKTLDDAMARTGAESERMRRLVNDLLELAKYDTEPVFERRPVDLGELCRQVASDAEVSHGEGVDVVVRAPSKPITIVGDSDRLRQAIANVLGNALVHGGPDTKVKMAVSTSKGLAKVSVKDDGPGMPRELAARAAERFVRADEARSRRHGGAGLGLAITSAIVEGHGGTVAIASSEGKGTTVTISIPIPT